MYVWICAYLGSWSRQVQRRVNAAVIPIISRFGTFENYYTRGWLPLLGEYGTCTTVKARFWPQLSGKSPQNVLSCRLFARQRHVLWELQEADAEAHTAKVVKATSSRCTHLGSCKRQVPRRTRRKLLKRLLRVVRTYRVARGRCRGANGKSR